MLPRHRGFLQGAPAPYAREDLSHDEEYAFQAAGYLCVPSVLDAAQVSGLSVALDASIAAHESPLPPLPCATTPKQAVPSAPFRASHADRACAMEVYIDTSSASSGNVRRRSFLLMHAATTHRPK